MRVDLVVTMDDGTVLRGTTDLFAGTEERQTDIGKREDVEAELCQLDFRLPTRPFMKRYSGELSGPKKLTLLVAYLAKGQTNQPVARIDVEKEWKKMGALLGGRYNAAYDTRARDNGWISSPKAGSFQLLEGWMEAIGPSTV
jgi:hypothetical protein